MSEKTNKEIERDIFVFREATKAHQEEGAITAIGANHVAGVLEALDAAEAFRAKVREMREAQEKRWSVLDPNDAAAEGYAAVNDIASKLEAEVDEMINQETEKPK